MPVSTHFTVSAWRLSSSELWEVKHKHIWPFCCTRCLKRLAHILCRDEICWQESNDYSWFLSNYQFLHVYYVYCFSDVDHITSTLWILEVYVLVAAKLVSQSQRWPYFNKRLECWLEKQAAFMNEINKIMCNTQTHLYPLISRKTYGKTPAPVFFASSFEYGKTHPSILHHPPIFFRLFNSGWSISDCEVMKYESCFWV